MNSPGEPPHVIPARDSRDAILTRIAVAGPIVVYLTLHLALGLTDVVALALGTVVAAGATVYQTISRRRPNRVAILVATELAVSLLLVLVTHNPRIFLYKPAVSVSIIGLYLLSTCIWGPPMAYHTALTGMNRRDPARGAALARAYESSSEVRSHLRVMTAAWGAVLLLDAGVRIYFARTRSIAEALIAPHIVDAGLIAIALGIAVVQFRAVKRLL